MGAGWWQRKEWMDGIIMALLRVHIAATTPHVSRSSNATVKGVQTEPMFKRDRITLSVLCVFLPSTADTSLCIKRTRVERNLTCIVLIP